MKPDQISTANTRRQLIKRLLIVSGASMFVSGRMLRTATAADRSQHEEFMAQATRMRQAAVDAGDQSYGAVVVKDGKVVGLGPSRVITGQDPTAHAEMEAVRDAARQLGSRSLSGCVIYATSRPCRMCETACYWANINRIYYSQEILDGGRPQYSSC